MQHRHPRRSHLHMVGIGLVAALIASLAACGPPPTQAAISFLMLPDAMDDNFFMMPFPNDVRRDADGTLQLEGLYGVELLPGESPTPARDLLPTTMEILGDSVHGFGVSSAIEIASEGWLDPASFPTPSQSTSQGSPVQLINLDDPDERAPVIVDFQVPADRNRPSTFLSVLPYPGHPLRESTRYGLALTTGLRSASDVVTRPAPLIAALDDAWTPATGVDEATWLALQDQRDDVVAALTSTTPWRADQLLAFTVFTTQDVDGDLRAVTDAVAAQAPSAMTVSTQGPCTADAGAGGTPTSAITGTIALTRWQEGTYPYEQSGGGIVVGGGGHAVAQGTSLEEFSARVPCGAPPSGGWPAIGFIDGTGGTWNIAASTAVFDYAGYVYARIAPVYGVGRDVSLTPLMTSIGWSPWRASEFIFYNFANPRALRSNMIQQAAEHLQLLRGLAALQLDGATLGTTGTVGIDPSRLVASGHSQGAQTLPMVAWARPDLAGVLSSAGSGGIFHTAHGQRELLGAMIGDAAVVDELNPILQIGQGGLDGGDSRNFPSSTTYLNLSGYGDGCAAVEMPRHTATAIGLPVAYLHPWTGSLYGDAALDPPTTPLPAQANVGGRTRVNLEMVGGHYVAYDQKPVTSTWLASIAAGDEPTVPASGYVTGPWSTTSCGSNRWDVPPRRFAR